MNQEKLNQIHDIVIHFRGRVPTDVELAEYCTENNFEIIDLGTLDDYTHQKDVDEAMKMFFPLIAGIVGSADIPSGFDDHQTQLGKFRNIEKDVFDAIVKNDIPLDVVCHALSQIQRNLAEIVKNVEDDVTAQQSLIANTFMFNHFKKLPRKTSVSEFAKFIEVTRKAIDDTESNAV